MKIQHLLCQVLFLCTLLLTFFGCSKDELDTTGSIVGVITDAETSKALSGATVSLSPSGKSFTTGTDGRYEFRDIEMGNYTVQATKAGYAENQKNVEVRPRETSNLDLPLRSSAPKLELSTQTLDFGSSATTLTLDIRNTGAAELTWQVSENIQWLSCVPISGSTGAGKTSSIVINVDRSGHSHGSYSQTIAITSNGGSKTVTVTMSVQEETVSVEVNPETLDFGSTTSSLQLTLTNTDASRSLIAYTLTPSNNWIHLSKTQGQFTYSEVITVSVNRTSLTEKSYEGQLTLTIEGRTKVIPVKMTVAAKEKPTVTLTAVKDVTYNSATFLGAIVSVGSSHVTHHGFVWSTTEQPTLETAQKCDFGDAQTAKDIDYTVPNLQASTTYYVRAYAENDEGVNYSGQQKFTTTKTPSVPVVETGSIINVKQKEATVAGNITDVGATTGITAYGHVWSTQPNPTVLNQKTDLGATTKTGAFNSTLKDLKPGTLYYIRAYASNQYGVGYGEDIQMTTLMGEVLLTTKPATEVTHAQATLSGTITDTGGNVITERGVCYGTSVNPSLAGNYQAATETGTTFSVRVKGLSQQTTYHARAYACTQAGETYYGNDITFATTHEIVLPAVSATTVSKVTYRSAKLTATVISLGGGTLLDAGFLYSTTNHLTTATATQLSTGTQTNLAATLSGLQQSTTYYVCAYVRNEQGTTLGDIATFTTAEDAGTSIGRDSFDDDDNLNLTSGNATITHEGYGDDENLN